MAHDFQNGEHTEEWPAADRPLSADDSDAPVNIDDAPTTEMTDEVAADTTADMPADMPSEPLAEQPAGTNTAAATVDDGDVRADNVDINNGGARDIDAQTVSITNGGARDIDATTVTVNQGGVMRARADEMSVSQGGIGVAQTEHLTIQEGGNAFAVFADSATLDPETNVFLLVAGSTKGDVRPVMDWRAAVAFGAGFALVMQLLRRLRRS